MNQSLYFLPGALGNTEFWQPVIRHLPQYQSQTVSYPAFHNTPSLPHITNFNQLSDHVIQQMPRKGILIAQSMGGLFAIRHAIENPDQVQALVLVATSGGIHLDDLTVANWREHYKADHPTIPHWFTEKTPNYQTKLHQIKQPVLLIWADQDPISPLSIATRLNNYLPHAQQYTIHASDHHFAATHALEVASVIESFITSSVVKTE
ncbi:alpha/beta hydrolase [Acinetobacter sp. B5B]|uniref:alpha/beta fold hydrolase n=1 Tax=Acinetobacter baretiae TaxID=2605383 RepID=UPI0018C29E24|nr:alpha/beta hydrolase [Acinetobacter baretiae]MBF7683245.1 alpha/beta hydrolase [Acinetobacter baretiae]MBF7684388.1 alpha/beta hydrolase [Acinetobacter baretiae]